MTILWNQVLFLAARLATLAIRLSTPLGEFYKGLTGDKTASLKLSGFTPLGFGVHW